MDFNLKIYQELLKALQSQGFLFYTVSAYAETSKEFAQASGENINPKSAPDGHRDRNFTLSEAEVPKLILLRHDVEARYGNALKLAQLQHGLGIKGTYYFRIYPHKDNEAVIRKIVALGHEIGYHYDDLTECRGDYEKAIRRFQKNLEYLRQFGPVTTAAMEGAPLSGYDNRDLWAVRPLVTERSRSASPAPSSASPVPPTPPLHQRPSSLAPRSFYPRSASPAPSSASPVPRPSPLHQRPSSLAPRPFYHYRDFGILTEPYFDFDFNELFYLTDTGRRWDGWKFSVRDKIPLHQDRWIQQGLVFRGTGEIIKAARAGALPARIMITVHPQRWNDAFLPWAKELLWQNVKNQGKLVLVLLRR
ncbi:hypothetical protein TBC1_11503 [Lentimicrobium saccharophilum]|uniref:Polysaccharide deacetylase n=1 Tax=Lentimicrobium saccharophilum TaxID=1678841 RepID=A0A0S7BZE2_9BACT|nr:hypothetical protein [Lentimicrobium saccharophilum]GAP42374.1 hypothetical protein TBC1_11503 [Lentimicrobium saccharophilum]